MSSSNAFLIATTIHLGLQQLRPANPHDFSAHPLHLPDGTPITGKHTHQPGPHPRYAIHELTLPSGLPPTQGQLFEISLWTHSGARCIRQTHVVRLRFTSALRRVQDLAVFDERADGEPVWEFLQRRLRGAGAWNGGAVVMEAGRCGRGPSPNERGAVEPPPYSVGLRPGETVLMRG